MIERVFHMCARHPWATAATVGVLFISAVRPFLRHVPDPPPVLARIPHFDLVNQYGKPFGSRDLHGKVYVATFFFTSCRTICPAITRAVVQLQKRFSSEKVPVQLVSFSVDPDTDTPAQLQQYARRFGVDTASWTLVTGKREALFALISDGFGVPMDRPVMAATDIVHSGQLALVDGRGNLRGFYRPDTMGLDELFHRVQHVLRESPQS